MAAERSEAIVRAPESSYRSLCPLAVAGLVCGAFSVLALFGWTLAAVPAAGILFGLAALKRIRRAPDELSGAGLARAGIALSAFFWAVGAVWLLYAHAKEVPHGYTEVSYEELQGDASTGGRTIPPRALELADKKIFVKGYMYPGKVQINLKQFIVSRDNGTCEFCTPNPTPSDLIHVTLVGDLHFDYTSRLVSLGGTLRAAAAGPRNRERRWPEP